MKNFPELKLSPFFGYSVGEGKQAVISKQEMFSTTLSRSYIVFTLAIKACTIIDLAAVLEFHKLNENRSVRRAFLCFHQSDGLRLITDFSWQQFKAKRKSFDQKSSPLFLQIERFSFDHKC